jgi:hypothetical protein
MYRYLASPEFRAPDLKAIAGVNENTGHCLKVLKRRVQTNPADVAMKMIERVVARPRSWLAVRCGPSESAHLRPCADVVTTVLSRLDLPVVSHEIPPVDLPGHAAAACPNRDGYGRPPRLSYRG